MNCPAAPIRVLLVEPHADTRELYVLGLTRAGFHVLAVENSASAALAWAAHAPTIVVIETRLPDRTAAGLLTRFSDAGVPVIALTTDALYQHHASRAGVSAVLLKPCSPDDVAAAIRVTLGVAPQ